MKKIDIEKWDRKILELPESFFKEIQENVLSETIRKKKKSLYWVWWSSAAAVSIIFGIVFFLGKYDYNQAKSEEVANIPNKEIIEEILYADTQNTEEVENRDVKYEVKESGKVNFAIQKLEQKPELIQKETQTKQRMEMVINAMNEEDFRELASNYEDIYLEFY